MIWHQDKHWKPSTGSTLEGFKLGLIRFDDMDEFFAKSEILVKFAWRAGFDTFLYIIEFSLLDPKYRSDNIRNGKNTPKMYFQATYIYGNFWEISTVGSGFVLPNLSFGFIYFSDSKRLFIEWLEYFGSLLLHQFY